MSQGLSGFPEFLPGEQIAFNKIIELIKEQFELHGFSPIDTPAVEKISTLLSKGNDNEIYGIYRLTAADEDSSKKDLALRFDLTVPLARYVSQHYGQLTFPYKRYHIAPVWRGERPQQGRYRQFYQCDIDIIGDGSLSLLYDAELLSVTCRVFNILNFGRFIIKINNRNILTGLLKSFNIAEENIPGIIRIIDKIEKISAETFTQELRNNNAPKKLIEIIRKLSNHGLSSYDILNFLETITDHPEFQLGVSELRTVLEYAGKFNVPKSAVVVDPTLARGLTYYTGTIYETKLVDMPELGSVCGGGRYANLTSGFSNKNLPGVGVSFGISRMIPKMLAQGLLNPKKQTTATVLITVQNPKFLHFYIKVFQMLMDNGINAETYFENKPLAAQMKYASKKGHPFVIIADEQEILTKQVILRKMDSGEQQALKLEELIMDPRLRERTHP